MLVVSLTWTLASVAERPIALPPNRGPRVSRSDHPSDFEVDQLALGAASIECRISQRGASWHWQIMNDLEQVLASGIVENELAARNAGILQGLRRFGI